MIQKTLTSLFRRTLTSTMILSLIWTPICSAQLAENILLPAPGFSVLPYLDDEGNTGILASWRVALQPNSTPLANPLTARPFEPITVVFKSADGADLSISHALPINAPVPNYIPGASALAELLRSGELTASQCECVVHYDNDGASARRIGFVHAQGVTRNMSRGISEGSCAQAARSPRYLNETDLKPAKAKWFSLRSCVDSKIKITDDMRTSITQVVTELQKIEEAEARRRQPNRQLVIKASQIILSGFIGGMMWRMRGGGGLPLGSTQAARLLFVGGGFSLIGALNGLLEGNREKTLDGAIAGFLMLPGAFLGYDGNMDLSQGAQYDKALYMTGNGLQRILLPAAYLTYRGYDPVPLAVGGAAMGACYLGTAEYTKDATFKDGFMGSMFDNHTSYGEFCTGTAFGTGLALSLATKAGIKIRADHFDEDLGKALESKEFREALTAEENTVFAVANFDELEKRDKLAPTELETQIAQVCSSHDRSAFGIYGSGTSDLMNLATRSTAARDFICQLTLDEKAPRDPYARPKCGDLASVIANQYERICRTTAK